MRITVDRKYLAETYTIGKMFINGEYFCDTLEDKVRDLNKDGDLLDEGEDKIYGQTAIPYGKYRVILNYSPKFKRELPLLLKVPNFEAIRIHRGNDESHSAGCLLVGENKVKGKVINSAKYEIDLVNRIKEAISHNEEIWITIQ